MLELYFIFYRVPRMMTRLARERNRSAIAWSLLGVGAWIGGEIFVMFTAGFLYGVGAELWDWPEPMPAGLRLIVYILALLAALVSSTFVSRYLMSRPKEPQQISPPPPPNFA